MASRRRKGVQGVEYGGLTTTQWSRGAAGVRPPAPRSVAVLVPAAVQTQAVLQVRRLQPEGPLQGRVRQRGLPLPLGRRQGLPQLDALPVWPGVGRRHPDRCHLVIVGDGLGVVGGLEGGGEGRRSYQAAPIGALRGSALFLSPGGLHASVHARARVRRAFPLPGDAAEGGPFGGSSAAAFGVRIARGTAPGADRRRLLHPKRPSGPRTRVWGANDSDHKRRRAAPLRPGAAETR